jgi:hypothetical protein
MPFPPRFICSFAARRHIPPPYSIPYLLDTEGENRGSFPYHLHCQRTPTYFLTGTASNEAYFALHLQKTWQKIVFSAHDVQYNAIFGPFQGSHVGNLSDLQRAPEAPVPPITSIFP